MILVLDSCAQVHEAIMRAPSNDMPDGSVLQEFRRGFKIGGTLLRPAMVQVTQHIMQFDRPRCAPGNELGH